MRERLLICALDDVPASSAIAERKVVAVANSPLEPGLRLPYSPDCRRALHQAARRRAQIATNPSAGRPTVLTFQVSASATKRPLGPGRGETGCARRVLPPSLPIRPVSQILAPMDVGFRGDMGGKTVKHP